jgi:hypothetical protein
MVGTLSGAIGFGQAGIDDECVASPSSDGHFAQHHSPPFAALRRFKCSQAALPILGLAREE